MHLLSKREKQRRDLPPFGTMPSYVSLKNIQIKLYILWVLSQIYKENVLASTKNRTWASAALPLSYEGRDENSMIVFLENEKTHCQYYGYQRIQM